MYYKLIKNANMENTDNNYNENIARCPYHAQLNATQNNNSEDKDANTGDWDDEREDNRTSEEGYDNDQNDNSGGAGSSGSASTNS
ncbi:hypothetical protein DCO46_03750 [Flavobacterium sp. HTF]|nr:hypothetical protein DCO46_03750 [Flavobacterium sp. HTF]